MLFDVFGDVDDDNDEDCIPSSINSQDSELVNSMLTIEPPLRCLLRESFPRGILSSIIIRGLSDDSASVEQVSPGHFFVAIQAITPLTVVFARRSCPFPSISSQRVRDDRKR